MLDHFGCMTVSVRSHTFWLQTWQCFWKYYLKGQYPQLSEHNTFKSSLTSDFQSKLTILVSSYNIPDMGKVKSGFLRGLVCDYQLLPTVPSTFLSVIQYTYVQKLFQVPKDLQKIEKLSPRWSHISFTENILEPCWWPRNIMKPAVDHALENFFKCRMLDSIYHRVQTSRESEKHSKEQRSTYFLFTVDTAWIREKTKEEGHYNNRHVLGDVNLQLTWSSRWSHCVVHIARRYPQYVPCLSDMPPDMEHDGNIAKDDQGSGTYGGCWGYVLRHFMHGMPKVPTTDPRVRIILYTTYCRN